MTLYDLKTRHMHRAFGIDMVPEFSWKLNSGETDVLQKNYRIVVRDEQDSIVWDSGIVQSRQQSFVLYEGDALCSRGIYTWTVTVEDDRGKAASASETFEMGLLKREDWSAKWIGSSLPAGPAVRFDKTVTLGGAPVAKARLYATAYGVYRLTVNGTRPDDREFAPEFTTYQKRLCYQTYDVTELLRAGKNELSMYVGDGWYFSPQAGPVEEHPVERPAVLLQLEVTYENGDQVTIGTDGTETCRTDFILSSDIFQGEAQDFTQTDHPVSPVDLPDLAFDVLRAQAMPPVRPMKLLAPKCIYVSPRGETIVDFGQLLAGRARIELREPKGTEVTLEYFETTDREGNYLNTMYALQKDTVLSNGEPLSYEALFTFHGFRYIRVTGVSELREEDIIAVLLTTEKENAGDFISSDPRLNRLYQNVRWSQYNNMMSVPTDCPGREKGAYTGDLLIYCRTALLNEAVTPFLSNWMRNVADDQKDSGVVTITAPYTKLYNTLMTNLTASFGDTELTGVAGWSDAAVWVPYAMYQVTGNTLVLQEYYSVMKRWTDWVIRRAGESCLWNTGFHFGEWLIPSQKAGRGEEFEAAKRSSQYTAPFFGFRTVSMMAEIAQTLGTGDASYYEQIATEMKEAIEREIFRKDQLPTELMGAYVLAFAFGLVPEDLRDDYKERLLRLIDVHDGCLDTGFLATPFLLDVLCDLGETALAHDLLWNDRQPSWLYEVDHGATAIWEAWDADEAMDSGRVVSFQHYAFGCVDDWMCRHIAGISSETPGYRHLVITPEPDERLTSFERTFESEAGTIRVLRDGDRLTVTVPCNATATITWNGTTTEVGSGVYNFL